MRYPWLILLFSLISLTAFAQGGSISGTVTNADSKKPVARASVFLSNSQAGTATNEEGKFYLGNLRPGQYTLVISFLGFEDFKKTIIVQNAPIRLDVELTPKPLMLREVVISSEADWRKNYEMFRTAFIGNDANARFCEVTNPHILNLTYNQTKKTLHAEGDEFLVVLNHALGYKIKFLVRDFTLDNINRIVSTGGDRVFEELPGNAAQKKKWHDAREAVYYGSSMHFLRSVIAQTTTNEGFKVYTLKRELNPERLSESAIAQGIVVARQMQSRDSMKKYYEMANMDKWTNQKLIPPWSDILPGMPESEYSASFSNEGLFALHTFDYLYIVYTKKMEEVDFKDIWRDIKMPNYQVSVLTPENNSDPIFDKNGVLIANTLTEGTWSKARLSDELPIDYVPDIK
jgi:hypothetical protein